MSDKYPDKLVIGLTGNIATGKSLVRRILENMDVFGIDADSLVHRAMAPGAPAFQPIVDTYGKWLLTPEGQIDRKKLGKIVFSDPEALARLEAITHPIVRQVIGLLIKRAKQKVVVIEAIKLIEGGLAKDCDSIWVVDAPPEVQLKRLMERGLDADEARARMQAQSPQANKLAYANVIINNAGDIEQTYRQINRALKALRGEKEEPVTPAAPVPAAKPAEPAPAPQVAAPAPPTAADVVVRRGGAREAEAIARFFNTHQGTNLTRTDFLVRFGQYAYMLATAGEEIIGVANFQVENLICRVPEIILAPSAPAEASVQRLLSSIEQAAGDLQSEVVLLFLPKALPAEAQKAAETEGYSRRDLDDIKVHDWREAARESGPAEAVMMLKQLRTDRVLEPI